MKRRLTISLASMLLATMGCATTYKFSPPPPGHPANPNLETPAHEPSMTLAMADSVDPRAAQSYQWTAERRENPEPQQHRMHQMKEESVPVMTKVTAPVTKEAEHQQHQETKALEPKTEVSQERAPDNFDGQLAQVLQGYFETAAALAADDFPTATKNMKLVQSRLKGVDPKLLEEAKREQWKPIYESASQATEQFLKAPNIEAARTAFESISEQMEKAVRTFSSGDLGPVYRLHCPMRGAYWLQPIEQVNNPYYGESMLRCGTVTDTLATEMDDTKKHNHDH